MGTSSYIRAAHFFTKEDDEGDNRHDAGQTRMKKVQKAGTIQRADTTTREDYGARREHDWGARHRHTGSRCRSGPGTEGARL